MRELFIDIETFSPVNLAKSGVYPYADHDDFELLDLTPFFWWTPDIQPSRAGKKGNLPSCPSTPNSSDAMLRL
ncbi:hypothetical protein BGK38_09460 [Corynebacterium diphtheriae]|uniref:hypothetical protein n=1 Tax=Corynebacterium diphtheriae TaxID=1717 RepID=UPI0008693859|nr:hypothetical protein [Corynebacterium diphtheriae]ODS21721.1 hypothetical protein BGK38_09460 [Corynebacterium diphtheriae]OEH71762.1 hypothetical protein BHU47_10090 [Corynebacterium diphtheriae]OEH73021.1 hypothetical protein BHU48_10495 [Corynebacterium diphtheriae]OLN19319.1 hypothetical protein BUE67_09885 [Corynebacterium diphtheriae]OLO13711.1 hypothetical protein BUV99_10305 [Corynebacterium diphtheriae]